MSLRQILLSRLRSMTADQPLPMRLVFWDGEAFELGEPRVTITLGSRRIVRDFVSGRFDRLGDAYVKGDIRVDGDPREVIGIGIRMAERLGRLSALAGFARILRPFRFRHTRENDKRAISHHYDVPWQFYEPWLDASMTYSCAYFPTGEEDIDAAQRAKVDHICAKLRLSPQDRVLDIGCGWGGLLARAGKLHGISGVGVTNSPAQHEYARELMKREGLADRIEIRLQDYRDIDDGPFDKIVSVGMYEHVGVDRLPTYFSCIDRLLKPGGMLLNHGIITTDPEGRPQGPPGGEFIDRHVFPGGELTNISRTLKEIAAAGLEAVDVEDLRPHYARTLQLWTERFEAARDSVIATGGIERYRVWRIYLPGMAEAFDRGWLSIAQIVAYKPVDGRPAPRPWSRAHQYGRIAEPPAGPVG